MKIVSETVYQENLLRADADAPLIRFMKSKTEFDGEGRQLREFNWDAYGNVEQMLISEYAEDGRLLRQEVYLDEDTLSEEHFFEYDERGRIATERRVYAESGEGLIHYHYDSDDNLIGKMYLDEDGNTESSESWLYEGGKLVAERRFEEGELIYEHIREFEGDTLTREVIREDLVESEVRYEAGNPQRRIELRNGKVISTQSVHFDEAGKPSQIDEHSEKGRIRVQVSYDDAGNEILREEIREDGVAVLRLSRTYTESGDPLETEVQANTRGMGIDRHYKFIYEYVYA